MRHAFGRACTRKLIARFEEMGFFETRHACSTCEMPAGDGRFGGPIWWNTPLRDDEEEADEDEHRTQWEQDTGGQGGAVPAGSGGMSKRAREQAEAEDELPEEVQARLKALRGD
jgi:bud site selection protein 31